MATSSGLIKVLKQHIRQRGLNYRKLADSLGLSESAVKRMFATGNMSLQRLDEVCEILGLDLRDLLALLDENEQRVDGLSSEDEQKLIDNPQLLLVAYCIINNWATETILQRYTVSESELIVCLAELDRMKMIELLPGNRVKTLVANNFKWQSNGPIERFFRSQVQHEFFSSTFTGVSDMHLVKMGDISPAGQVRLGDRLKLAGQLFDEIAAEERHFPPGQRQGTTMVVAIRHWEYTAFRKFERDPEKRLAPVV